MEWAKRANDQWDFLTWNGKSKKGKWKEQISNFKLKEQKEQIIKETF